MQDLERYIVDTKDFPKKGVTFKDVSPLLKEKLRETVSAFTELFNKETLDKTDYIAGIDSRGFVFGSALAQHLGKGFIMIRKAGKLPPPTVSERYSLEYGTAEIEMSPGSGGVIIIDDVLATGGTLAAAANLCKRAGYDVLDIAVLLDLKFLNNFSRQGLKAKSLIQYYDNDILIVMALESECQGYFAKENVIYTGVGKTNASYALMKAINKKKPKLVLNLGSAGSAVFNKGELINCTEFIQRDMDVRGLGFEQYVTPFDKMDEQVLKYGNVFEGLKKGICGSGDNFDTSSNKTAAYNLVDMEAYALAKICKLQKIPFTCVKYITDGADGGAGEDWSKALNAAAKKLFECYKDNIAAKQNEAVTTKQKIHVCLFNIHHINYVVDQVEFILAAFKQNGYQVTVGNEFKDDALNLLIECFDELLNKNKGESDVEKIINYCEQNNKKVAVIMTEHIDYIDRKIHAYSVPLDKIDETHYNPLIKPRILSLLTISPYIKHIFTLGEFPKLKNFQEMMGKAPIVIPYPKIEKVHHNDDVEYDFIFSGRDTKYRSQALDEIAKMSFSVKNNAYQNILTRKKRNKLISKAKVNLNIPQDENWRYPSSLRIILALSLGKLTISVEDGGMEEDVESFYAKVSPNNLSELESYLKQPQVYYQKYLEVYNEIVSKAVFPHDHFRIWGETERVVK